MKQKHFIFLFVIFVCAFFLMPDGVAAAGKRLIHECKYTEQNSFDEYRNTALYIYDDYTYDVVLSANNRLFRYDTVLDGVEPYWVTEVPDDVEVYIYGLDFSNTNWNGCPQYMSREDASEDLGRPGTFYFTFGSSESEVREDTIEGNEVSIATLTQSVDPGMCYYTIEGYATTVDQAAFGVYQQEPTHSPFVGLDSYSASVHWGAPGGDNADAVINQRINAMNFFGMGTTYEDLDVFNFQCLDQVYLVRDNDGSYLVYTSESFVPDDSITTNEYDINTDGYNQMIGCDTLFNFDEEGSVGWFLQRILDYIKIFAPIIVVLLSSIDFIKAIFSSDEKATKQAQQKLVIRLVCALALFLVPTLVQFLLNLINGLSNPNCGFH